MMIDNTMYENYTVSDFLNTIHEVYEDDKWALIKAQTEPQMINFVVGKIMVKSKGKINPELAIKITKCIVESDLPNTRKLSLNES